MGGHCPAQQIETRCGNSAEKSQALVLQLKDPMKKTRLPQTKSHNIQKNTLLWVFLSGSTPLLRCTRTVRKPPRTGRVMEPWRVTALRWHAPLFAPLAHRWVIEPCRDWGR